MGAGELSCRFSFPVTIQTIVACLNDQMFYTLLLEILKFFPCCYLILLETSVSISIFFIEKNVSQYH